MQKHRFDIAAGKGETVVVVHEAAYGSDAPRTVVRGVADWMPNPDYPGDASAAYAAVRTPDGELHTGKSWPSYAHIFTVCGCRVNDAVVYGDRAGTVAALAALGDVSDAEIVNALADEVEEYRLQGGWLATVEHLAAHRPAILENERVVAEKGAVAERKAAEEAESRRRVEEHLARMKAMTAVAVGDATAAETLEIRERIARAVEHAEDGTARTIDSRRWKRMPVLRRRGDLESLCRLAVPVGNGDHVRADKLVRVRWQESPDESDVSGVIPACRGRKLDELAAGVHNCRTIRKVLKAEAARQTLADLFTVNIDEAHGVPAGAVEIEAARDVSTGGYGTRYYLAADGCVFRTVSEYDWPVRIRRTAVPVKPAAIAAGLGIKRGDMPARPTPPEQSAGR